jgi:hypothetical protein
MARSQENSNATDHHDRSGSSSATGFVRLGQRQALETVISTGPNFRPRRNRLAQCRWRGVSVGVGVGVEVSRTVQKRLASRCQHEPKRCLPKTQRRQGCEGPGSARFTCLLDFRDGYYARSGLLNHLNGDRLGHRSGRLFHFPRGFLHWRGFRLGLGNRSLRRFRSLRYPTCLPAFS